ncbi:MAG: FAD-binding protein [Syntrophobacterales bacterium]|nr:FAD-binding protein [Syntrophobacterales bacterium]
MHPKIIQAIQARLGPGQVLTDREDRWTYAFDATELECLPDLVVFPGSAEEVAAIVRLANEHRFPVIPRGAGSGRAGGAVPVAGGVVLVLTRLNRILEINPADFVAVVEPGVITGELKRAVAAQGLYYPPDPGSSEFCTIGGNVATGAGGAVAVQYGVTRDYVLGLEVVLPTGEIIQTGTRTMKSVVGYDLTHLLVGSEGTLGVITKIILRLVPPPAARQTLAAGFRDVAAATAGVGRLLRAGVAPASLEFLDAPTLKCVADLLPFPLPPEVSAFLFVALEGHPQDVAQRTAASREILTAAGAAPLVLPADDAQAEELWRARKAVSPATRKLKPHKIAEDVAVPLGAIPELVAAVQEISRARGLPILCFGHAGDGNIHVNIMFDARREEERRAARQAVEDLLAAVRRLAGTLSGEHGIGLLKAPFLRQELSEAVIALQRRLKQAFDPRNIMNPGKIFPGEAAGPEKPAAGPGDFFNT